MLVTVSQVSASKLMVTGLIVIFLTQEWSIVIGLSVCLSLQTDVYRTTRTIFTKFFVHVTSGHCSVLLWQHRHTLCASSFVDDIIFIHNDIFGVGDAIKA